MSENNKIMLVRSSKDLIKDGLIGYGWKNVDFSQYKTTKELFDVGFKGIDMGRKKIQIKNYFELKINDIVIVPVGGAIAVGIIEDETKIYDPNSSIPYSSNRIKVNFFKSESGQVLYVPRVEIATNLEQRLKIRKSIADLESFRNYIEKIASELQKKEIYTWDSDMQGKIEEAKNNLIKELIVRLRTANGLGLAAGGYGLEKLVREIFEVKGYTASIPAKNSRPVGEDVDVIAQKEGEFGSKGEKYLVQVKHHQGTTGGTGLDQLIACKDDEEDDEYYYKKILITTAKVNDDLKEKADLKSIIIVEGDQLAEIVYDMLDILPKETLLKLGISTIPSLI